MGIIKILPENLINQIAAGEVVERPASVVKELIENSIDAGSDEIVVEIKNSGKTFIKIKDNGCGMSREDCELALQRHATSKIFIDSDLWKISTMGFRGEALASIASVSKMVLKSRRKEDLSGTEIDCEGGEIRFIKEIGMSSGTQIEVYNLFFNTPARQKYLKKESTEFGHIVGVFNMIALAHSGIAFKLIDDGRVVSELNRSTDLISRIADIFGKPTSDAMLPVFYGGSSFQIDGFVGKPLLSRSTSQHQYFFVNGRGIQHHLLANMIKSAFHSMLMENKKPVFIINIKIDPALIDVNVHPRKIEIRFEDQEAIIKTMYGCVKTALEKNNLIPKGFTEAKRYMSGIPSSSESQFADGRHFGSNKPQNYSKVVPGQLFANEGASISAAMNFSREILKERESQTLQQNGQNRISLIRSITQIAGSYIVAENEEGLILIDQHAAHERVRFEQLMGQFENQEKSVQPLLVPQQLELSKEELALISENSEIFENLGFEIEPFGGNTFVVQAVPAFLSREDIDVVIKGVLDDIINKKNPSKLQGKTEEIITYMSCRSAIKFGQKLSLDEMQALIMQMEKLKRPYTCPHGRPTMVSLTLDELNKMFGRK